MDFRFSSDIGATINACHFYFIELHSGEKRLHKM